MIIHSPGFTQQGTLCGGPGGNMGDVTCPDCCLILARARGPKDGDFVSVPYHDGLKSTTVYGIVERAGAKTFTVRWESGRVNRVSYLEPKGVKRVPRACVDETGLRRLLRLQDGE